jgi:hypothetical protein
MAGSALLDTGLGSNGGKMRRGLAVLLLVLVGDFVPLRFASANVFVGHTDLTIQVRDQTVSGKLVGRPGCRPDQTIELWVDGALQGTTTTDSGGNYSFSTSLAADSDVQTRFGGSRTGSHPDRFICEPALSRLVIVLGAGADPAETSILTETRGSAAWAFVVARHEALGF